MISDTNELMHEISVSVRPISPVFVWSGETLYSDADFKVIDNKKILIIDIMKVMENSLRLEDGFKEENVREINGYKMIFDYNQAYYNIIKQGILMINEQLIPASSLKGLFRTAFANDLVKNNKHVLSDVRNELDKVNKARGEVKKVGDPIEKLFRKKISFNTEKDYDFFTRLIISEPKIETFKLNIRKINIDSIIGNFHKEALAITLDNGLLNYRIKILKPINYGVYNEIKDLDNRLSKQALIDSLKKFGEILINKEIEKIKNNNKYKDYEQFLNTIRNSKDCIPLRIGMFTSHIAKTVEVDNDINKFRSEILSKVYRHHWDNITVKTTRIDDKDIGVGWIKVCVNG